MCIMIEGMERKICGQENESGCCVWLALGGRRRKKLRLPTVGDESKDLQVSQDSWQ